METLIKILKAIYLRIKQPRFIQYRFYTYNGTEQNKQFKISNSIEYTIYNTGTTVVYLNNFLKLYPSWSGIEPSSIKLKCNLTEVDETIYHYSFSPYSKKSDLVAILAPTVAPVGGFRNDVLDTTFTPGAKDINGITLVVKEYQYSNDLVKVKKPTSGKKK